MKSSDYSMAIEQLGEEVLRDVQLSEAIPRWNAQCTRTRLALSASDSAFRASPAVLLISTQHDAAIRALLLGAERRSIPTVYIPHAPVSRQPHYLDLPFSYAGLRGAGEVAFYSALGVDRDYLRTVGNPSTNILTTRHSSPGKLPVGVLALSPNPVRELGRIVSLVSATGADDIVVAPHPASNMKQLRQIIPERWEMWEQGKTLELLRLGPRCVIQYSSGVAWESAALGIPTGELRLDNTKSSYPFLDDQSIFPRLFTSADISMFLAMTANSEVSKTLHSSFVQHWCDTDGKESHERAWQLLQDARVGGVRTRLLDGWGRGGTALRRSRLKVEPLIG